MQNDVDLLIKKFLNGESITLDLISRFNDENFKSKIINNADLMIYNGCKQSVLPYNKALISIAVTLTLMANYTNDAWDVIRKTFKYSYHSFYGTLSIDNVIRDSLNYFRKSFKYENSHSSIAVPLISSGVPLNWIGRFYDFCYEIYKVNFNYSSCIDTGEIKKEIFRIFNVLRKDDVFNDSDEIEIQVKATRNKYKLSKYTQSAIKNGVNLFGIVDIATTCIKSIIDRYNDVEFNVNPYFLKGFREWEKSIFEKNSRNNLIEVKQDDVWDCSIRFISNDIYLITKSQLIDNDLNPRSVYFEVYENGNLIERVDDLTIVEVIGGYKVKSKRIKLNCNVLNNISYKVLSSELDDPIFDSDNYQNSIYKNDGVLIFDEYGVQNIKNGVNYKGNAIVITKNAIDLNKSTNSNRGYFITELSIDPNKLYLFDDKKFLFRKIKENGVSGDIIDNAIIHSVVLDKDLPLFSNVDEFIYHSENKLEKFDFLIDGTKIDYSETFDEAISCFEYCIELNNIENGYHKISLVNLDDINSFKNLAEFVLDRNFKITKLESIDNVELFFKSTFVENKLDLTKSSPYFNVDCFITSLGNSFFKLNNDNVSISINANEWVNNFGRISLKKLKNSNYDLYFIGDKDIDIKVESINGVKQLESKASHLDNRIRICNLHTLKNPSYRNCDFVKLVFTKDDENFVFYIDLVTYVDRNKVEIIHDFKNKNDSFKFYFDETSNLKLKVLDEYNNSIIDKCIKSGEEIKVLGLLSFTYYKIVLYEKVLIGFINTERTVYSKRYFYADKNDMKNQSFELIKAEIIDGEDNTLKILYGAKIIIKLLEQKDNSWIASIEQRCNDENLLSNIHKVMINLDSQFNDDNETLADISDLDGDCLFFDNIKHTIYNSTASNSKTDALPTIDKVLLKYRKVNSHSYGK